jgi:trk system potassium uptake protein
VNVRHLVHVVGIILVALSVALGASTAVAAFYGGPDVAAFAISTVLTAIAGLVAWRRTSLRRDLSVREGYAVVSFSWLAIGIAGALPYLISGVIASPAAALFESISGFTTTGATVFATIEPLPRGILFWRALTQWIGGMGIIVLGVAILPFLGIGGMQLFRAEVPGPTTERLKPRIAQTAKALWLVYGALTAAQAALLMAGGMPGFDAITHAFTTLSTGGFSTQTASYAEYSAYLQYVTITFMLMAGINFTLHYRALTGRPRYHADSEWKAFMLIVGLATVFVAGALFIEDRSAGIEQTLRDALFQVISISTTTGYVSRDYEQWPAFAQIVLLLLMFVGGMAGSTAGGMKVIRVLAFFRQGVSALKRALHPRAVVVTRVSGKPIRENDLLTILAFILFFLLLFVAGTLALAALGHDILTSIGASAATLGNIGPGLGGVGAVENYGWMGPASHLLLCFLMLVGRLEIFTVLLLFHPDLWRRDPAPMPGYTRLRDELPAMGDDGGPVIAPRRR